MVLNSWVSELKQLVKLASPLLAAQLLTTSMGAVDTLMSGRYGAEDLAAVAVGNSIWLPIYLLLTGLLIAATSMIARLHGAKDHAAIVTTVQQSMWMVLFAAVPGVVLLLNTGRLLVWMEVDPKLIDITRGYLQAMAFGLPAAAIFSSLRSFTEGMGRTRPYMISSLVAFLANIPLNFALIYGRWGMPEMGGVGCGVATAICLWLQVVMMVWLTSSRRNYDGVSWYRQWQAPSWSEIRKILKLGLPISLAVFAEVSIFSAIALLLAPLGALVVAGHQIALTVSHIIFMLPLSMAQAITIRVGHYLGRGEQNLANFAAGTGVSASLLVSLSTMTLILLGRESIVSWFTNDAAVHSAAVALFLWMAFYQIPDQLQISANAALRAYQDGRVPMLLILVSYWGVALPLGYTLARTDLLGPPLAAEGFWIALVTGLIMTALLLGSRLLVIARRPVSIVSAK
ncbi:MATE family efflux transporter [Pseudomaricurvus alkylphenolicus]|uniref:MATE family efflux transporter n=1 Tax=Pseudomaricurvus alkylphenolicus TaxID=1306991 RepID=UPI0014241823